MTARSIPLAHLPQQTSYWCGPAAVRMALACRLGPAAPSQWALAQDEYLGTESHRETPNRLVIRDTLNKVLNVDRYRVHHVAHPHAPDELALFRRHLTASIDDGWPVVATFWVRPGGVRPPGYPDRETQHIVTIHAYADGGDVARVADPASSGCDVAWGASVAPSYSLPIQAVVTLMEGKGYVA